LLCIDCMLALVTSLMSKVTTFVGFVTSNSARDCVRIKLLPACYLIDMGDHIQSSAISSQVSCTPASASGAQVMPGVTRTQDADVALPVWTAQDVFTDGSTVRARV
jgi:hypothetical protein